MATVFKRKGAKKWTIRYRDHEGQIREKAGTTDKHTTRQIANKVASDVELRRMGVIDAATEKAVTFEQQPLTDHLRDFEGMLHAKGVTIKHVSETLFHIRGVLEACRFRTAADIEPVRVAGHVAELRQQDKSARTINKRITAMKRFTRWMHHAGRVRKDSMVQISKLNTKMDRRHRRRALNDDEIVRLIQAACSGSIVRGMAGAGRAMLYKLAVQTGLRASEIGCLTPQSLDLANINEASLTVPAAYSKRRRDDVVPICRDLADALTQFTIQMPVDDRLFRLPNNLARMLRADLEAAGIPYRDNAGRVVDFHSLRHTFITRLAKSGVTPAVAKTLARHSTITLTMDHYTHTLVEDERAALERLPTIDVAGTEKAIRATGTDPPPAQPTHHIAHCSEAPQSHDTPSKTKTLACRFPRENTGKSPACQRMAPPAIKASGQYPLGESNPCFRTENPTSWATRRRGQTRRRRTGRAILAVSRGRSTVRGRSTTAGPGNR